MAILDRTPKTSSAPARKAAPTLTHEQLRALPVGFDDEASPFYVAPDDRAGYAAVAGDDARMRSWRDSAAWTCSEVVIDPRTMQRSTVVRDPDVMVHGWVLDYVRRAREARARYAEQQAQQADTDRCQVCAEAPTAETPTTVYVITGDDVARLSFGLVGRTVLAHEVCALALRQALADRVPAGTRQLAAAYLSTL